MNIVFLGSGRFGLPALEALHRGGARLPLLAVVTRPDRPARRGQKFSPTPVRRRCGELGITCRAPDTANDSAFLEELRSLTADIFIVADYGEILSSRLLEIPATGVFNLHASLLPRHRGASPVVHALLTGDRVTGVTLFRIEPELDSGPVVTRAELEIRPDETAGELRERLGRLAAEVLESNLEDLASGRLEETPQDHTRATLAPKLKKKDGMIDWDTEPRALHNFVRAMNPWPVAYSFLEQPGHRSERTAFLSIVPEPERAPGAPPGTVVHVSQQGFSVASSAGSVRVVKIQRQGRSAMDAAAYLRGRRLRDGDRFGVPGD